MAKKKTKPIAFKAVINKCQTMTNGCKRVYLDVDIDDKHLISKLDEMTEADGVMVAVAIDKMN